MADSTAWPVTPLFSLTVTLPVPMSDMAEAAAF